MNINVNSQYRVASFAAVLGLITYGFMRLAADGPHNSLFEVTLVPFYLSIATAFFVFLEHMLFKRFEYMPFVTITTMIATMTIGAYISEEWDYYFLATLGMTGIVCLYGKIRPMVLHLVTTVVSNLFVISYLIPKTSANTSHTMIINFFLYFYAALFLFIQFYRANKRANSSQSGLQAFNSLLGSTPNLMVIVDDKRRVRYISTPLAKFAGMDERVSVGRPLVDLFNEESLKIMFADILDAESFYSATREIDVNDEPHYFKIIADKLADSGEGMFIEITDMTEIVLASIEADQARREAESANKSKSAFLATMSHEIRTPMNAIIGVSEIQLLRDDLPDGVSDAIRQIQASGHGLLGIINDILDLSKIETGKLEIAPIEYDVASMINDAVQLNMVRIGSKSIAFSLNVRPDLPAKLVGDEMRLKQILNNILSNAFKYTDKGTVKLAITHRLIEAGIELTFSVSDTGQGMKPEDLSRLFDEYSRFNANANRSTEGTGLGMNITRRLVNMMNGKIDVESEYGVGSTFTVTVLQQPSECADVIGQEHAEKLCNFSYTLNREAQNVNFKREYMPYGKILVVDDVETNLYVARGLLAPYGLKIDTALSGFEVIEKVSAGAEYDIIFMDHMMPKMDGVETTSKLRESGYQGIIIALTANAIAGNDKYFKENGFEDFISKPIDIRRMNVVLNQYVRDRHAAKQIDNSYIDVIPEESEQNLKLDKTLLEIFRRDAEKAIAVFSETTANGNYKLFATTAHAMKSALMNIGENELSELAKSLEYAGNREDAEFINEHVNKLVDALLSIVGEKTVPQIEVLDEDTELLAEKLSIILESCELFDGNSARAALKELDSLNWTKETSALIDELSEMVLCSDFDEAAEKISDWLAHYSK